MAEFRFSDIDALWFNPLSGEGKQIFVERDTADDIGQVDLSFVQTTGARLKFNPTFDKTPRLIFPPGQFKTNINLNGIVSTLPTPNSIKIRINNVSEGDTYAAPSEMIVRLLNKIAAKPKENIKMPTTSTPNSNASDYSKISTQLQQISHRLDDLENLAVDDAVADDDSMQILTSVDSDTTTLLKELEKLNAKFVNATTSTSTATSNPTPTSTPTPIPTSTPIPGATTGAIYDPASGITYIPIPQSTTNTPTTTPVPAPAAEPLTAATISEIVLSVLQLAGVIPVPTTSTASVTINGVTYAVDAPTNKPVCDPLITTNTVVTPVEPGYQIVYKPCSTVSIPTPGVCGNYLTPIMATLENGWKNTVDVQPFPNSYEKTGYYKQDNRIYLMGNLTGTSDQLETSNKTKRLFTIPLSCAPKTQQSFAVAGRTSNGGIEAVELIIYPNADGSATVYAQNEGIMPLTIAIVGSYLLLA